MGERASPKILQPGVVFGRLTVLERVKTEQGWRYRCQCCCGNTTLVYGWCLRKGETKSCGCFRSEKGLQPGQAGFLVAARECRRGAARRGIPFDLTEADLASLFPQACHYCGSPPSRFVGTRVTNAFNRYSCNGIDRIDNTKGYSPDNVVPACWMCNRTKGTQDSKSFLTWVMRIRHPHWTPVVPVEPTKSELSLYGAYQDAAARRGHVILLSAEILTCYFRATCAYCGAPPSNRRQDGYKYTGVDRVDNEIGYEGGNTVAACRRCNSAKRDMPLADFLTWAGRLQAFQALSR